MAQENLIQISKDLSFKIFDPVSSGEEDGKVFFREHRLGYISRAFGQLVRTLEIIHPNIVKVFKNYFQLLTIGNLVTDEFGQDVGEGNGNTYELIRPYHVYDVFYAEEEGGAQKRADFIDPENYMPAKLGINSHYIPTTEDRLWTLINNMVMLLPTDAGYYNVTLFVRNYFPQFSFGSGIDIDIPQDYMDLLITAAAMEAMSDKGDQGKYSLYKTTFDSQLQLIGASKQREDLKEEAKK